MNKTKIVIIVLIIVAVIVGVNLMVENNHKSTVAANVPLTGPLAIYGEAFRDGITFALRDVGVENEIVIDWQDNQSEIKDAVSVLQSQLIKKPDLYISGLKPQTQAITDILTKNNIPHLAWILDAEINQNSHNNFRIWVNFKLEAETFLSHAGELEPKRVAITYVDLPSADYEYNGIVIPGLKDMGVQDVFVEPFLLDKVDMKDTALKIVQYNPDLLIVNGFIPQMVNLIQELNVLGFDFEGKTLASIDMLDAALSLSNEEIEGIVVAAPKFIVNETDEYSAWRNRFKDEFDYEPLYHHAYAYDMGLVINEVVNSDNIFESLRSVSINGITGPITFDEDQSLITNMIPAVYRGGELISVTY